MIQPDLPRVPPPIPPVEPPPLPPEPAPEVHEPHFEVRELETPDLRLGLTSIPRTEVKPDVEGSNEDTVAFYPDEKMAAVFDGAGGYEAGEIASMRARDYLPAELIAARKLNAEESDTRRAEFWNELVEANVHIRAKDAEEKPFILGQRREEALRSVRAHFERVNPPQQVKEEALAIYRALQALSNKIFQESSERPEFKEMQTTAVGMKFMEIEGRRFAIFFGVGDSEAYIEHEDPQHPGRRITERAIPSDNLLEVLIAYGNPAAQQAAETGDFSDPFIRQARFAASAQLLGQADLPTPRVRIWEIHEDDRFLLASDGLADADMTRDYASTLTEEGQWGRKIRAMGMRAIEGFQRGEGKAGTDDISIVAGEIKAAEGKTETVSDEELRWSMLVGEVLDDEVIAGQERKDLEKALLSAQERQKIASAAYEEARQRGLTDDLAVTHVLRENLITHLIELRLERARRNIRGAGEGKTDLAAE